MNKISVEQLAEMCREREIYIWGARAGGRNCWRTLSRLNIAPAAFLDSDESLQEHRLFDLPILPPSAALSLAGRRRLFIIVAANFYYKEISAACREAGLTPGVDFISVQNLRKANMYTLEAVNLCNLRCLACPCGNEKAPARHSLTVENAALVFKKIQMEDPLAVHIDLFNWGEPFLNPALVEIVREALDQGFNPGVSTNLNIKMDYAPFMKAGSTSLIVSGSGYGATYEWTHTGGRWDFFVDNMTQLARARDEHNPELNLYFFYHLYKYPEQPEDARKMRELCQSLGFSFMPLVAYLSPYDAVADVAAGRELTAKGYREAAAALLISPKKGLEILAKQERRPCIFDPTVTIDADLTVKRCCVWHDDRHNYLAGSFLETPLADIEGDRRNNPLCRKCKALHLEHYLQLTRRDFFLKTVTEEPDLAEPLAIFKGCISA
jgi:Predicted Fe-S oxidoreductases